MEGTALMLQDRTFGLLCENSCIKRPPRGVPKINSNDISIFQLHLMYKLFQSSVFCQNVGIGIRVHRGNSLILTSYVKI